MHIILAAFIEELLTVARSLGWLKHGASRRCSVRPTALVSLAQGQGQQFVVEPPLDTVPPGAYDRRRLAEGAQAGLPTYTGEGSSPGRSAHPGANGQGRPDRKECCGTSSAWSDPWQQDSETEQSPGEYVTFTQRQAASATLEVHTSEDEEYEDPEPRDGCRPITANVQRGPRSNMGCCGQKKLLMITTSLCASASFAFLCVAVATDYWLHTKELEFANTPKEKYTCTYMGLWRKCDINVSSPDCSYSTYLEITSENCTYINYFEEVDMDGLGPTQSIQASMRRSTIFPLISLLILLIGEIVCFVGHCHHKKKVLTFVAGILFVIGGLCTLIGIILFIGAITGEVGSDNNGSIEKPKFAYTYGSSFMLTIGSFIVSELTGVLSVYLYISRHKHAYRKKQERLTMVDSNERQAHGGRYRRSHSRDRTSRDHSGDNSPCHSDTYYTYTPVSDASKDMSNYTIPREMSRHTMSTSAETHLSKEHSLHSVRDLDTYARRTTPV